MAKKKARPSTNELQGKKVALVGKFGYKDHRRGRLERLIAARRGKVVPHTEKVDFLFVGEGRGSKPPGEVAKVEKASPDVIVLAKNSFLDLLMPDIAEILAQVKRGHRNDDERERFWHDITFLAQENDTTIDLERADLSNANLQGAHMMGVNLTGADLRGANLSQATFDSLNNVNLDKAIAKNLHLDEARNCTFRETDLEGVEWFDAGGQRVIGCDFSRANLRGLTVYDPGTFENCKFVAADVSDTDVAEFQFKKCDFSQAKLVRLRANEAKFADCNFAKADLQRADLRSVSLKNADLRRANLREAVLCGADLTGAKVAGTDFQGANLAGAKLGGVDVAKARHLVVTPKRVTGPKLKEFIAASQGSTNFETTAVVDLGEQEFAVLEMFVSRFGKSSRSKHTRPGQPESWDSFAVKNVEQGIRGLVDRWHIGKLRLDSITASGSKTVKKAKLQELAVAAWAECFGVKAASPEELKAQHADQAAATLRDRDELIKRARQEGSKKWRDNVAQLKRFDLRGADFSGAQLDGVGIQRLALPGANFSRANLSEAHLWKANLTGANLADADLHECHFDQAILKQANLRGANLAKAIFEHVPLQGTNFTDATLTAAEFLKSQFDETTTFPADFQLPLDLIWKGKGERPGLKKIKAAETGSLSFDDFVQAISGKVDSGRLSNARSMLKKDKFQLFAEVKDDSLVGIVKSQTDKELVYSCRLASNGAFSCCTQNLRPCGGLRGAICKHLLVLIIGLAKAGELDPATVNYWVDLSRGKQPAIDQDIMSATFLRYKGAEAGEVDWRPTETIPEDFYAM